jgi:predicted lipoprotein with Yx(FWY)xxD motif
VSVKRGVLLSVFGVVVSGALVTACGSSTAAKFAAPDYHVDDASVAGLGGILVDGTGYTLYIYQPDGQGPSKCYSLCASEWPPLDLPTGVTHAVAGPGVQTELLGVSRRSGGALQVTYNHWPLYLYRDDRHPGEVTGQAEDMGAWYVMAASGAVDRNPLPMGSSRNTRRE